MTPENIETMQDVLTEAQQRWPGGLTNTNLPNVHSFLSFRLQIPDLDTKKAAIRHIKILMWLPLCDETINL